MPLYIHKIYDNTKKEGLQASKMSILFSSFAFFSCDFRRFFSIPFFNLAIRICFLTIIIHIAKCVWVCVCVYLAAQNNWTFISF